MSAGRATSQASQPPPPPSVERMVCERCDYVCFTAMHLSKHAAVHTKLEQTEEKTSDGPAMFQCSRCPFSSAKRPELRSHLLRGHPGRHVLRTYRCPYCTFESLDGPLTEDHVDQNHPGEKCVFEVNRDVLVHVDAPPCCLICDEKFALSCLLRAHIVKAHGSGALEQHKVIALEDDYDFPEYSAKDKDSKPTTTAAATTAAATTAAATTAAAVGGSEEETPEMETTESVVPPIGNIAKFHCDFCEFDTNDFHLFDKHMMTTHGPEVAKEHRELHPSPPSSDPAATPVSPPPTPSPSADGGDSDSRPFKCSHCPYTAQSGKSLWSHNKNHERFRTQSGWKCSYCNFMSDNRHAVLMHQQRFHPGQVTELYFLERHEDGDRIHNRVTGGKSEEQDEEAVGIRERIQLGKRQATGKLIPQDERIKVRKLSGECSTLEALNNFKALLPDLAIFMEPRQCPCCTYCSKIRVNLLNHVHKHAWSARRGEPNDEPNDTSPSALAAEDEYYDSFDDQSDAESEVDSADLCTRVMVDGRQWYQCNTCDYTRQLRSTVQRHYKHEHEPGQGNYRCPFCDSADHSGRKMVTHLKLSHPDCPLVLLYYVKESSNVHGTNPQVKMMEIEVQENQDTGWLEQFVERQDLTKCCSLCKLSRSSTGAVQMHVLAAHFRYYPYQCSFCPKVALGVLKIKSHIEKEHQGKPYKVIRRGKLSYERAQEHRHKDHEIIHMLDPLPESEKEPEAKIEHKEIPSQPAEVKPEPVVRAVTKSPKGKQRIKYFCKYCPFVTQKSLFAVQTHIFYKHQKLKVAVCDLCGFGSNMRPYDERMRQHFEQKHPGYEVSWTNHSDKKHTRIVPVEETEEGCIVAAIGDQGEVLEFGAEGTEGHSQKRTPPKQVNSPVSKRQRTGVSPIRDLRLRGASPALDTSKVTTPGIDVSRATVSKTCLDRVEERIASNRTLFGCSECYFLFDRKDKACYHLQIKHNMKPFLCGICSNKYHFNSQAKLHMQQEHPDSSVPTTVQEELLSELRSRIITVMLQGLPDTVPVEDGGVVVVRTAAAPVVAAKSPKVQCAKKSTAKPQKTQLEREEEPQEVVYQRFPYETFTGLRKKSRPILYGIDTSMYPQAKILNWPPMASKGKKWACDYCTFETPTKQTMIYHVTRHTTWRRFSCKMCNFKSFVLHVCEDHVRKSHRDAVLSSSVQENDQPEVYYMNKFTMDSLKLKTQDSSQSKTLKKEPIVTKTPATSLVSEMKSIPELRKSGENPVIYQCNFCIFARSQFAKVNKHQLQHFVWRPFGCNYCTFAGHEKQQVFVHQKQRHGRKPQAPPRRIPRPKMYKLNDVTIKKLSSSQAVGSTAGEIHSGTPENRSSSPRKAVNLSAKTRTSPTGKKFVKSIPKPIVVRTKPYPIYKCNYCVRKLKNAGSIVRHQQSHFTWRPYSCQKCAYASFNRDIVQNHIATKHGGKSVLRKTPKPTIFYFRETEPEIVRGPKPRLPHDTKGDSDVQMETDSNQQALDAAYVPAKGKRREKRMSGHEEKSETEAQGSSTVRGQQLTRTVLQVPDPVLVQEQPALYQCNYCEFKRSMQSAVKLHQRSHYTWRPFACAQCSFQSFKQSTMDEHQLSEHQNKDPKPRSIPEPDKFLLNKRTCVALGIDDKIRAGKVHRNTVFPREGDEDPNFCIETIPPPKRLRNGNWVCNFCPNNSTFGQNGNMAVHQALHFTFYPWVCGICNLKFMVRNRALRHMELNHPSQKEKMKQLPKPSKYYFTFATREMLGPRVVEFVGKKEPTAAEINCYRCSESFDQDSKLHAHLALEHPECVQFECLYCHCVLFTKGDLDEHHIELHGDSLPEYDIQPVPDVDKGSQVCELCLKTIPDSFPMNIHMVDQHKEQVDIKCSHCHQSFTSTAELRVHHSGSHQRKPMRYNVSIKQQFVKRSVSPFQHGAICPVCEEKVKNEWSLDLHLAKQHPQHVQFLCSQCGKLLDGNSAMKQHFQEQHQQEKGDYSVVRNIKQDLIPAKHDAPKPPASDMCSDCSTLHGKPLRIHVMDVHFQYHPYMCCFCPYNAAAVKQVKTHHLENHPNETLQVKQRLLKRKEAKVDAMLLDIKAQVKAGSGSTEKSATSSSTSPSKTASQSPSPNKRNKLGIEVHILYVPKTGIFQCKLCKYAAPTRKQVHMHVYSKHKALL